jgi:hypothetical protein
MWMVANLRPTSEVVPATGMSIYRDGMQGRINLSRLIFLITMTLMMVCPVASQEREVRFVDERLLVPESEHFTDGSYIASGVGLKFGVEKRLTYLSGDYVEAANAFEESVLTYRYKAEVWVYLARAYFYSDSPELAKQTLQRANQIMPDLTDRLWDPLIASLSWEIRQRANQQQIQVDFYSPDQQGLLSLFKLYVFLEDQGAAKGVIEAVRHRSHGMRERSTMVTGSSQANCIEQAELWDQLAESLSREIPGMGVQIPAASAALVDAPTPVDAAAEQAVERERLLQLQVDFYRAGPAQFSELFDGYLLRGDTRRAGSVTERANQEAARLHLVASVAAATQDEEEIKRKAATMDSLANSFATRLSGADGQSGALQP